jgi:hypothetical protein
MMARFCTYVEKVFKLGLRLEALRDSRKRPSIPVQGVFASAFAMFATARGSLHGMEPDRRIPSRLQGIVGPRVPSSDTVGRVYSRMDSQPLREMLRDVGRQMKRNKVFANGGNWLFVAVDGHEFFRQPEALLPPLPDPQADDRRKGSPRILSPRRGLPSRGARRGVSAGHRADPAGRRRGDGGEAALG